LASRVISSTWHLAKFVGVPSATTRLPGVIPLAMAVIRPDRPSVTGVTVTDLSSLTT
jgi:hypothetical protein